MNIPHPIPYQGSKRGLAAKILDYFPNDVEMLVEPFAGSAAISLAAALMKKAKRFHLNDLNKPLIDLIEKIVNSPEVIARQYAGLWKDQNKNPQVYYKTIRGKFNESGKPEYFLYLLARCVKASVRYNSRGEFNQSPDNRRLGTMPETMRENIIRASFLLKGKTTFSSQNYRDVLDAVGPKDMVYMDPPYQGVCGERDSRYVSGIQICEFIETLEFLNKRGIRYIVSYDGRTGDKAFGKELPSHLNLLRVELNAGRSTQATFLGREDITYESLYISPTLKSGLAHKGHKDNGSLKNNHQLEFAGVR
jgi:DNA adenine methylase